MADTALFVGWGETVPGREHAARRNYEEFVAILERQKEAGEIEDFQTVLLGPHAGILDGFTLVYGELPALFALSMSEEMRVLQHRALAHHGKFIVVPAVTGALVTEELDAIDAVVTELEGELVPA